MNRWLEIPTTHPQITQIADEMKPEPTLDADPATTALLLFLARRGKE